MASRILGMGDVLTLIEKAEQSLDQKKAEEMAERLRQNRFTLTDYYDQLQQIKGMGSLQDIAGMIPGMDAKALSGANVDEKAMGRIEAIIQSMTPGERDNPAILNSSRKKRIAAGAGTSVVEINKLLKQFELMQQLVRQMSGNSKAMQPYEARRPRRTRRAGQSVRRRRPSVRILKPIPCSRRELEIQRTLMEVKIHGQDQTSQNGRQEGPVLPHRGGGLPFRTRRQMH